MSALLAAISHFSILKGVLSPDEICVVAKTYGFDSVALIDCNNLYGLPAFLRSCKEHCLKPIIAAEVSDHECSALIYAHGDRGFENLCRVISDHHCNESFSLHTSILNDLSGLWIATDSLLLIARLQNKIERLYYRMRSPKRLSADIKKFGIPCLIAPAMVFRDSRDYDIHTLLRAIDCNSIMSRIDKKELFDCKDVFRSWEDIESVFAPFEEAVQSTQEFMENIVSRTDFGKLLMPCYPCEGSSLELLRKMAFDGARGRYGELSEVVIKRLNYELELITSKGFSDYFLIVNDIVKQSPRTCGRGSGAASIVAYSLGITNVDPIRYNLMFERFLNAGRKDPPDIDVDFAWDERDNVLDYVFEHYGKTHTAMVATHQKCGIRMAIRETARIYGCTEQEISIVTKKIPYFLDLPEQELDLVEMLHFFPATKDIELDPPWPQILSRARTIVGMPRGIGTHCGGVVITKGPIQRTAPVQYSAKGYAIIQWEKDGAEEMGLVKIDLLGNRSLAVIRDTIANVKSQGIPFNEQSWDPQTDPATVKLLERGESIGVFYVESPAMRLLQRKSKAGDFDHLVIHSSIIRPAANKYIQQYIKRLHGEPYTVLDPRVDDVLKETYGIMVYQEDVSKVAIAIAGFSFEDADMLRKIMSKKAQGQRFEDFKIKFYEGARAHGLKDDIIRQLWEMMLSFSGYSFCKPHSASYVQVSMQSAYLKAHHPAPFMAAVLSNYGGYYTTQSYISESQRLGVRVAPPDINRSEIKYTAVGDVLIVGLCQVKGLTQHAQDNLIGERKKNGYYMSIDDLLTRTGIDEADAEKLILAGACDRVCKDLNRSRQFWQMRCFYNLSRGENDTPALKPLTPIQFLRYQYRTLGFLTPMHPISLIPQRKKGLIKANQIDHMVGKRIEVLAWCVTSKTVSTKFGESMQFVSFEDETAMFETVFFPEIYKRYASILSWLEAFYIKGKVTEEFGVASVEVEVVERP